MSTYTEIVHFEVAETHNAPSVIDSLCKSLSAVEGLVRSYAGQETEDPKVLFVVIDWKSEDARAAFSGSAALEATLLQFASPGSLVRRFVRFDETTERLGAPITEFVTFTLKEGHAMDQLEPLVRQLQRGLTGSKMFYGSSWAPVVHESDAYHGILGWDTVEAHWDAVKDGLAKQVIDRIREHADLWLVHAALQPLATTA